MTYFLRIWTVPRVELTTLDELVIAGELLVVATVVCLGAAGIKKAFFK